MIIILFISLLFSFFLKKKRGIMIAVIAAIIILISTTLVREFGLKAVLALVILIFVFGSYGYRIEIMEMVFFIVGLFVIGVSTVIFFPEQVIVLGNSTMVGGITSNFWELLRKLVFLMKVLDGPIIFIYVALFATQIGYIIRKSLSNKTQIQGSWCKKVTATCSDFFYLTFI